MHNLLPIRCRTATPRVRTTTLEETREETMESGEPRPDGRWAIILAGGEGVRLRPLTRRISGDERPKQFCPLLDGETLLDWTRRRVALITEPERTLLLLTRHHEAFYAPLRAGANLAANPSPSMTWPKVLHHPRNRGNSIAGGPA